MQLSYNIIKKVSVNSKSVYTISAPVIPLEIKPPVSQEENIQKKELEAAAIYAKKIVDEAEKKSQDIIDSARKEAERIKKEAYDEAFNKGYTEGVAEGVEKGRKEGLKSVENLRIEAENLLKDAHRVSREYIDNRKSEILDLALHIAYKITGYQADTNDSVIVRIAQEAIGAAVVKEQVIIRVNPMDYAFLDSRRDELLKYAGENALISILKDDSVGRGGCRVESEGSFVDASLDVQFKKVREALTGR